MALILRDSIDATLIPPDTPVVAGYGDGAYLWSPSWKAAGGLPAGANWWDLFPGAVQLVIVVNAAHSGDVLDVEKGDATPADVPGWCDRFDRPGRRAPSVYCNRDTWPLVRQAAGGRQVDYWIGTLDGTQDVAGAVAVQYVDTGAYDESVIHDPTWVLPVRRTAMAIAPRIDGSGIVDGFWVVGGQLVHRTRGPGAAWGAPEPLAGGLVPWTIDAWWQDATHLEVHAQAPDGTLWAIGWNGAWGGWLPAGFSADLPAAVQDRALRAYLRLTPP